LRLVNLTPPSLVQCGRQTLLISYTPCIPGEWVILAQAPQCSDGGLVSMMSAWSHFPCPYACHHSTGLWTWDCSTSKLVTRMCFGTSAGCHGSKVWQL